VLDAWDTLAEAVERIEDRNELGLAARESDVAAFEDLNPG
jgi:hypothetical protein